MPLRSKRIPPPLSFTESRPRLWQSRKVSRLTVSTPKLAEALKHPQVRQAIEQEVNAAEAVKANYSEAIDTATAFARAELLSSFPELSGNGEQNAAALLNMQLNNPQRFAQFKEKLVSVAELKARQQEEQHRAAENERSELADSKAEDARFEKMLGDQNKPDVIKRAADEMLEAAQEHGISREEFMHLFDERSCATRSFKR